MSSRIVINFGKPSKVFWPLHRHTTKYRQNIVMDSNNVDEANQVMIMDNDNNIFMTSTIFRRICL